ncbi:MAG TPA: diguanylate cyclase [Candidatus Acidoferrales bacterium]|nr:diguanylate cyclase [Candidatus Acidoferrales bacterium]
MTLSTRLWLSTVIVLIALVVYCAVLIEALHVTNAAEALRSTTRETIASANRVISELKDVETGDRGFLLTGDPHFLEPYVSGRAQVLDAMNDLRRYTQGANASVQLNVAQLDALVAEKLDDAAKLVADRRSHRWNLRADLALIDRGKVDMDASRAVVTSIVVEGGHRLVTIDRELERSRTGMIEIALFGTPLVALTVIISTALALRAFGAQRARLQHALEEMGSDADVIDLTSLSASDFADVASAFNDMAVRLSSEATRRDVAEARLTDTNDELQRKARSLEVYSKTVNLVRRMADRLPACADEEEFSSVIQSFAPQLTHGRRGALYLMANSRNLLHVGASWNGPFTSREEFTPDDCWALRRGQEHISGAGHVEVLCAHILGDSESTHWCVPLVAQSETVGLLYLEGVEDVDETDTVHVLSETIALALVNLRLREKLRSQSVRDPLTALYNRRYLDETLDLELARAARSKVPIAVIMLDIDHFKKFNDTFGHEAGDQVLKGVAEVLATSMRRGDVAGRFGGEEFLLIMPGADLERAMSRSDTMRETIASIELAQAGQKLGRVTASFGVAIFPDDGETAHSLVQTADKALYAAKAAGRNRVLAARAEATS